MELQISQTRHPKSVADRRTNERMDGHRSGPTTRPAFAKATQVKIARNSVLDCHLSPAG